MSDFKAVGPTINDMNAANRDAWDSGAFEHMPSSSPREKADKLGSAVAKAAKEGGVAPQVMGSVARAAASYGKQALGERDGKKSIPVDLGEREESFERGAVTIRKGKGFNPAKEKGPDPQKKQEDAVDIRHPATGGQEIHHGEQVVVHHDANPALAAGRLGNTTKKIIKASGAEKTAASNPPEWAGKVAQMAAHEGKKALGQDDAVKRSVHLPRKANRTWRKGEWS